MKWLRLSTRDSNVRQRIIKFEISANKAQDIILGSLTYAAAKLWNVANYERKGWSRESGEKYPDWFEQKQRLKEHYWYKSLASQTAQELLKQLHEAWQSFYKLVKTGGIENPQPPGYKRAGTTIRYLNNGFQIKEGIIRLSIPKQQKEFLHEKFDIAAEYLYISIPAEYKSFKGNPKMIEIIPLREGKYKVNMIVELPKAEKKDDNAVYMAIDLGVNNLITCHISTGKSFIISGRQLLSTNRYFDKRIGYYQSIAYGQQAADGNKYYKKTKRIEQLYDKRNRQVEHLLHASAKKVVDIAAAEGVSEIIMGDIAHIRESKDMGRVNNQKFHKWPFGRIMQLLAYKAEDQGILTETQEESYTSQCSPYAAEVTQEYAQKGNRKQRGLYIVNGQAFNADCVGAYNILKKYLCRMGKTIPAVVGLDTPMMYRWDSSKGFVSNQKLAISMAM
ncbi:MAG: transposase [Clostridia bacterium]|nr:transposase [Clostridia bacterium]